MNRTVTLFTFWCLALLVTAQVTTSPNPPIDIQTVTITFDATQGNAGLKDYSGDIYAHTGVITDKSQDDTDWKYVVAEWSENTDKAKLTSIGSNKYTLELSPSINEYYGVLAGEQVEKLAFVFRSADGSLVGKATGDKDIFVDVATQNLTLSIVSPLASSIYKPGDDINIQVTAANATNIKVYIDDVLVKSEDAESLTTTIMAGASKQYTLKAEATAGTETIESSIEFYVRDEVTEAPLPAGLKRGVNIVDNQSVTMVLYAPFKEFVHVIGEFNEWEPANEYMMNKDGDNFWLTIDGLDADTEYAFQFYIDGEIRVADPYTNKTLDEDDKYIPSSVYPNLKTYPSSKTEHVASLFKINEEAYDWQVTSFTNPEPEKLIIYELHIRDFTEEGSIKAATAKIDYLKDLGVNAIELLPFNEFEGNDSWGYNPSFYFAADKAYGSANDYKEFIDACHQNGMAVIMDQVLNHTFGQSPFARMYLDGGKPASNNPWYNRDHNMAEPAAQWGYDFNHESDETQALVDSICAYWISEYKIDGYRFDFTKGFTNKPYPAGDWASAYDISRINLLKRMTDEIRKRKSDAIISFEHLSDNSEETELANYGILLWGNHNHTFSEGVMGYNENGKSDFSWASYQKRGWDSPHIINYMESHDEERIMYKAISYGDSSGDYDTKDIPTGLDRSKMAAAFLFTVPGPNMIWQFGELGYDYSINTCTDGTIDEGCRTGRKPIKWDYVEDENRMNLYKVYAQLSNLKKNEDVFSTDDYVLDVNGTTKRIELNYTDSDVRLIGNFGTEAMSISANFSSTGKWYKHFRGQEVEITDVDAEYLLQPGTFYMFTKKQLIGYGVDTKVEPIDYNNITIRPNPVANTISVNTGNEMYNQMQIFNISGSAVAHFTIDAFDTTHDVSNIPAGVYLLKLHGNSGIQRVVKFIKK